MPLTYTGRSVKPGAATYPSLVDIAVGLSRQPRFAGQGRRWFSVLDHSLFVDEIVKQMPELDLPFVADVYDMDALRRLLRVAVLLHDAHEAITADVPTTFKGPDLKYEQKRLDELILGAYFPGGYELYAHPSVANMVRHIDRRALAAEARVIGPAVAPERILHAFGVTDDTPQDIELLQSLLVIPYGVQGRPSFTPGYVGRPPFADGQDGHPSVREYLGRIMELL